MGLDSEVGAKLKTTGIEPDQFSARSRSRVILYQPIADRRQTDGCLSVKCYRWVAVVLVSAIVAFLIYLVVYSAFRSLSDLAVMIVLLEKMGKRNPD